MAETRDIEIRLHSRNAESDARRLSQRVESVGHSADRAERSLFTMTKAAIAVSGALASRQVVQYADAWTNANNRIRAATENQDEFIRAQQGVISIAQEAGISISSVADGYSRLAQNTSELNLSQERVLAITKKVTLAIKAGGATAQEAASIIVQLGQGLGSGALQGDELKSIMEASIPITKALAKEFEVTTGELKKLGSDGKITADRVVSALERMDEKSLTFTKDISSGFTEVSNSLTVYIGRIDESVGATEYITAGLSSFAANIDELIRGAAVLVALVGVRYVGALGLAAASQVTLTLASLRGTVQMNAFGAVTARTTFAMNASALAARGLGGAMALLGGPAGLAVIAAAALYTFGVDSETAEGKASRLSDEVNHMADTFKNLSKNQKGTLLNKTESEMSALSEQLVKANTRLNQFKEFSDSPIKIQGIRKAKAEIFALNEQMDDLSRKQEALIGAPDLTGGINRRDKDGNEINPDPINPPIEADKKSFDSLLARLKLETDAIQSEEEVRRAFNEGLINQKQLDNELALQDIYYQYEARRAAILENEKLTDEQKTALLSELSQQEIDAESLKQSQISEKVKEGSDERSRIEQLSRNAQIDNLRSGASASLSLLSAFGKKSSKAQKAFAIADAVVNIASGMAKALNNPYPANLGFAAKVAAQGVGLISTIKGATPNGAATSPTISTSSGATPSAAQAPVVESQNQNRVINFVGLENFGPDDFIPMTKTQFIDYMSQDENVNVAINSGQQSATRTGAI